jgi:hypothetical protein
MNARWSPNNRNTTEVNSTTGRARLVCRANIYTEKCASDCEAEFGVTGEWLDAMAATLLRKINGSSGGAFSFDLAMLAAGWNMPPARCQAILCEASRLAGLAVGIIETGIVDIMTPDLAHRILAGGLEIDEITWHDKPSPC